MVLAPHNADDPTPWREPGELLRRAIEEVRQPPPPPASLQRALARARQIEPPPARTWTARGLRLSLAAAVASLFITIGVRYGTNSPGGYLAETTNKPAGLERGAGGSTNASGRTRIALPKSFRGVRPPTLWRAGMRRAADEPGNDVLPASLSHFGSHWGDWEAAKPLRDLARGIKPTDRQRMRTAAAADHRRQPGQELRDP
jgi:hypothetical protein